MSRTSRAGIIRLHSTTKSFDSGWTVSVQWGSGNYCDNKNGRDPQPESETAEVAAWKNRGAMHTWPDGDQVLGYQGVADVAKILDEIGDWG